MNVNIYIACHPCGISHVPIDPATVVIWIDVYGRAVTEGVCSRCEETRRVEWDPTIDLEPVIGLLRASEPALRVVRVGSILARITTILDGYERFGPPTDAELHAELERLEERAKARGQQA